MDSIEAHVKSALCGEAMTDESALICDYGIKQQINDLAAKGVDTSMSVSFVPVLQRNVCYIVAAVVFNDRNEVLMMQEAKSKCAGMWYLPAGRMEHNEHIVDAVKREVLEETGLHFEPTSLLMVECAQGNWFRFVFTGNVAGGQLKTVSQADSESLQACWVADINQLSLRANDCLRLIEKGKEYLQLKNLDWHSPQLPVIIPHKQLLLRVVVAIRRNETNRFHVLVSETQSPHLPVCEMNPTRSIHAALKRFMNTIFGERLPEHRPCGLLSVEHSGKPSNESDGLCLTLLVLCKVPLESATPNSNYTWLQVEPELESLLMSKLAKNMTICLKVI